MFPRIRDRGIRLSPAAARHVSRGGSRDPQLARRSSPFFPPAFKTLFEALIQGRPLRPKDDAAFDPRSGRHFCALMMKEGCVCQSRRGRARPVSNDKPRQDRESGSGCRPEGTEYLPGNARPLTVVVTFAPPRAERMNVPESTRC